MSLHIKSKCYEQNFIEKNLKPYLITHGLCYVILRWFFNCYGIVKWNLDQMKNHNFTKHI